MGLEMLELPEAIEDGGMLTSEVRLIGAYLFPVSARPTSRYRRYVRTDVSYTLQKCCYVGCAEKPKEVLMV